MKYIITGGAGFIGSHLADYFLAANQKVLCIDDLSTGRITNLTNAEHSPDFSFLRADAGLETTWMSVCEPDDIIIHLAATVGVNKVCENPLRTLDNNAKMTQTILEAARKGGNKVFFASTSEIYGECSGLSSSETDSVNIHLGNPGRSAYVLGKLMSEQYCLNFSNFYGIEVIIGRFFNVIGQRQLSNYGMVVPKFIEQACGNQPITIYGNGEQKRSFCDVHDVAEAIDLLIQNKNSSGKIFNIGNDEAITINKLAETVISLSGSASEIIYKPFPGERSDGSDTHYRMPNLTRITAATGWRPGQDWKQTVKFLLEQKEMEKNPQHAKCI